MGYRDSNEGIRNKGRFFILIIVLLALAASTAAWCGANGKRHNPKKVKSCSGGLLTNRQLKLHHADEQDKLMIVAHPDDETLWGGAHLAKGGYFVVCLTNGYYARRASEFKRLLKYTGNQGMILCYPDLVSGRKSDWALVKMGIDKDLRTLIGYQRWKQIVTHNPEGEYGHIHHKMTDRAVTRVAASMGRYDRLWYFGRFYRKGEIPGWQKPLSKKEQAEKNAEIAIYPSQQKAISKYWYWMIPYEHWIKAGDWEDTREYMLTKK
ncbi:MAG: PIG-L deacetylase family protein [Anaerovoracaceae bacterium]|jgi:LmbE family N-acetylglucosaminyl deacetylase